MGTVTVDLEVGDASAENFESLEALVDTGSTYTVIPASILRRLGIVPHRKSTFELADGTHKDWEMGRTWVRLDGKSEMTLVAFGDDRVEPILGAVTLEEFLLAPDPIRRRLVPVAGLLMHAAHRPPLRRLDT